MTENTTTDPPAGRELDALVAERVLGWERCQCGQAGCCYWRVAGCEEVYLPPACSTDLAAAWEIVERMKAEGYSFALWDVPIFSSVQNGPIVAFRYGVHPPDRRQPKEGTVFAHGGTPAEAICRAALLAVEKHDG